MDVNMICLEGEMSSRPEITFSPGLAFRARTNSNLTVPNEKKEEDIGLSQIWLILMDIFFPH